MKKNLIIALVIIVINLIACFANDFASWYAKNISKLYINTLGRLFDLFPFSVFEWLVIMLIIFLLVLIIKYRSLTLVIRYLLILILIFTLTTGINYHRQPLNKEMNFKKIEYTIDDLKQLCNYVTTKLETLEVKELSVNKIHQVAKRSMNEIIPNYYPNPKPMFFSDLMTRANLSGIFSPFTIEANYNQAMPTYNKPFTICHELSHLAGYMSEDEANFIAYLACTNSNESYFNYSGYLTAFVYLCNTLSQNGADISAYQQRLPTKMINDLKENNQFWHQYGDFLANIVDDVNDTYLKINSVSEGVNSYNQFIDLIYSYYKNNHVI